MTQLLPITYDNIDALAASAFAKSRDCLTAIQLDILHNIKPMERVGFQRLVDAIENRQIFTQKMVDELDVQIDFLTREIAKGTTVHQHYDYDECNVSAPACWQEKHTTERASELGRAIIMFLDLNETLQAVHDLMHAETALSELRQSL
jgi:hypothetical protein